ncbi:MAG: DUF1440 domain-containing protein [Candidatus Acidiferrales bacterium]
MDYRWRKQKKQSVWKGIAAGVIGGLAAAYTMSKFEEVYGKASRSLIGKEPRAGEGEDPTIKTANKLSRTFAGHGLGRSEKKRASTIVHYAFASALGGVYGGAAEVAPVLKKMCGVPFGAAVFVGAEDVALPMLKLSKKPWEYPVPRHLSLLGAHCVYGLTTELVRRGVRRVF